MANECMDEIRKMKITTYKLESVSWIKAIDTTVCFRDFAKLNLPRWFDFKLEPIFDTAPQLPPRVKLTSKVVKVDSKIIVSIPKI